MHAVFRMNKLYVVIKYNHSHKVILRTAIKPYVCWSIMKNEQQILYPAWVTGYSKFNNGIVQLYWHCTIVLALWCSFQPVALSLFLHFYLPQCRYPGPIKIIRRGQDEMMSQLSVTLLHERSHDSHVTSM